MSQAINQAAEGPLTCLDVVICTDTTGSRVQLRGDLDLATAPDLVRLLDLLCRDGHRQIILDLSGLGFSAPPG